MDEIKRIITEVEKSTSNIPYQPFSPEGYRNFKLKIAIYISTFYIEAQQSAKWRRANVISDSDVDDAFNNLIRNTQSKTSKLLGIIGGLLTGAVLSHIFAVISKNEINTLEFIITVIFGLIGGALLAINFPKS